MNTANATSQHYWLVSNATFAYLAAMDIEAAQRFRSFYQEPMDQCIFNQMRCVNHFWRLQLATLPVSTIHVRECIVDNVDIDTWLQLMAQGVIPELIRLRLPRDLSSYTFPVSESPI